MNDDWIEIHEASLPSDLKALQERLINAPDPEPLIRLTFKQPKLANDPACVAWLKTVEDEMNIRARQRILEMQACGSTPLSAVLRYDMEYCLAPHAVKETQP